jgi:hypothetical protein
MTIPHSSALSTRRFRQGKCFTTNFSAAETHSGGKRIVFEYKSTETSCEKVAFFKFRTALSVPVSFHSHSTVCSGFTFAKSEHHHTIQINQPTRCNSFTSLLLLDVYVWLNMFRAPLRPVAYNCTRSLWLYRWRVADVALLVVVWQVMRKRSFFITCQPTATLVNITTCCKYSQVLLMMGENIARNM